MGKVNNKSSMISQTSDAKCAVNGKTNFVVVILKLKAKVSTRTQVSRSQDQAVDAEIMA